MTRPDHERFIRLCHELAAEARDQGNTPVGSVVVLDGAIIGQGIETLPTGSSLTGHAETLACQAAIDATKEILQVDKSAVVVMVSAMDQMNLIMDAIQAGARDYIQKPFKTAEVGRVLERALKLSKNDPMNAPSGCQSTRAVYASPASPAAALRPSPDVTDARTSSGRVPNGCVYPANTPASRSSAKVEFTIERSANSISLTDVSDARLP